MKPTTDRLRPAPLERRQAFADRLKAALEDRILRSASTGNIIEVVHSRSGRPGEVRVGDERIISDDAVTAVHRLAQAGILRRADDDRFELAVEA